MKVLLVHKLNTKIFPFLCKFSVCFFCLVPSFSHTLVHIWLDFYSILFRCACSCHGDCSVFLSLIHLHSSSIFVKHESVRFCDKFHLKIVVMFCCSIQKKNFLSLIWFWFFFLNILWQDHVLFCTTFIYLIYIAQRSSSFRLVFVYSWTRNEDCQWHTDFSKYFLRYNLNDNVMQISIISIV